MKKELAIAYEDLPVEVVKVMMSLQRQGFCSRLVGGAVRDYFLTKKWGHDFDIEVYSEVKGLADYGQVIKNFQFKAIGTERLPFYIYRLQYDELEIELAPPRIENFNFEQGHKNFTPQFDLSLNTKIAGCRRDFTVNSIYLIFTGNGLKLDDPFSGRIDLKQKRLETINSDFIKDPVRVLRAIRFHLNLDFSLSAKLQKLLPQIDLTICSDYYFSKELDKCLHPLMFLKLLSTRTNDTSKKNELEVLLGRSDLPLAVDYFNWGEGVFRCKKLTLDDRVRLIKVFGDPQLRQVKVRHLNKIMRFVDFLFSEGEKEHDQVIKAFRRLEQIPEWTDLVARLELPSF
jgi:hypothetical protein